MDASSEGSVRAERCLIVIFGATGDLTRRKLMPALWELARDGDLPGEFAVVGVGRRALSVEAFRAAMREGIETFSRRGIPAEETWDGFAQRLHYARADVGQAGSFLDLAKQLEEVDREHGTGGNRLYYFAIPPGAFLGVFDHLREGGLLDRERAGAKPWRRVLVEKPFGRDLATARTLNRHVLQAVDERQVFRIDHYLAKETVQNILVFRFANAVFEPLWTRLHVDHVQITAAESIGVEGRGRFYEEAGVLRDIVQNHLLEVLALTAMEAPVSFAADAIRDEKVKVFRALRRLEGAEVDHHVVRGQYGASGEGESRIRAYREEDAVAKESEQATYVALELFIDNWRWQGVPFYLRAGKRLARKWTEVVIVFRAIPYCLFGKEEVCMRIQPNELHLRIQPDEGIGLGFAFKEPGDIPSVRMVPMDFRYADAFGQEAPLAYERVILDALRGDATLFPRTDGVEEAWRFVTPILERWEEDGAPPVEIYPAASWGPPGGSDLLGRTGRWWRHP